MSGSKGALHEAKLLEGRLVRLIQRRDRQAAKADADFLLDLLHELKSQPDWLVDAVRNALQYDQRQAALLTCIESVLAIDKRKRASEVAKTLGLLATPNHAGGGPGGGASGMTFGSGGNGLAVMGVDAGLPDDTGEPAVIVHSLDRYPEPGEPAMQLPDGRIVAASRYEPEPEE